MEIRDTKYASVKDALAAVGKEVFIKFYDEFKTRRLSHTELSKKLHADNERSVSTNQNRRIYRAYHIFEKNAQIEALQIIINSKVADEIKIKAKELLIKEVGKSLNGGKVATIDETFKKEIIRFSEKDIGGIINYKNENTVASIIAFFLSKFNKQALDYLNYSTITSAFQGLANKINAKPNYIKLRRDEFDVFFPENMRQGWSKREPTRAVVDFFNKLNKYSFEDLAFKVTQLIETKNNNKISPEIREEIIKYSEEEVENIINFEDDNTSFRTVDKTIKMRILNYSIIPRLKKLYEYHCQICGKTYCDKYGVNIVEGHHMIFFVESMNNDSSNIIILCPDHHRLMHKAKPIFDRGQKLFIYPNGYTEKLLINYHL